MRVLLLLLAATVSSAQYTDVTTGQELYQAVQRGEPHIRITKHLDTRFTILDGNCTSLTSDCDRSELVAVIVSPQTKSIRGSCNGSYEEEIEQHDQPPLVPALAPVSPGQCLLYTDKVMFALAGNWTHELWLDNLFIRTHRLPNDQKTATQTVAVSAGTLWLSNLTLQSDEGPAQALLGFSSSRIHAEDITIRDFRHIVAPAASAVDNTTLHFERCAFINNTATEEPGVVTLLSRSRIAPASAAALRDCSFLRNSPAALPVLSLMRPASGTFYSDEPRPVLDLNDENVAPVNTTPLAQAPLGGVGVFAEGAAASPRFDALRREALGLPPAPFPPPPIPPPPATPTPAAAPAATPAAAAATRPPQLRPAAPPPRPASQEGAVEGEEGGSGEGAGRGAVIAAALGGAAVVLLLGIVAWLVMRARRGRRESAQKHSAFPATKGGTESAHMAYHPQGPSAGVVHPGPGPAQHGAAGLTETTIIGARFDPSSWEAAGSAPRYAPSAGTAPMQPPAAVAAGSAVSGRSGGSRAAGHEGTHSTLAAETTSTIGAKTQGAAAHGSPGAGSSVDKLEDALDELAETGRHFMGRYLVGSNVERRSGGQGVVQFARIANTPDQVAIKFYTHREAFTREAALYANPAFKDLMPATLAIEDNAGGGERLRSYAFPPCIIIEKGQSLNEWAHANRCDFVTIFQALSHSVRALAALHDMGYAHRDIKPGNILRRPKQHDWTLIDFGCAARIGAESPVSFSLVYAAPETVLALEAGARTINADAAVDIWAVGVIAFELLSGERAFPFSAARADVLAAIAGRRPLPWEAGAERAPALRARMRGLKRTVLQCLRRDPEQRPTAADLLAAWDHLFDSIQTQSEGGGLPSDVSGVSGPGGTTGVSGGVSSGVSAGMSAGVTGASGTPLI